MERYSDQSMARLMQSFDAVWQRVSHARPGPGMAEGLGLRPMPGRRRCCRRDRFHPGRRPCGR